MKEARDKNKVCAAVLTDLSKVFDCQNMNYLLSNCMFLVLISNLWESITHILATGFR